MAEPDFPFSPLNLGDPNWKAPDLTEATEGWRVWQVESKVPRYGLKPRLNSVAGTHGYYWEPRKESIATCTKPSPCSAEGKEGVPGEHCSCGFYSAKSRAHMMSQSYYHYDEERDGFFRVVGIVANWGKVIEGTLGWRAEKSYPVKLFVPYEAWKLAKPLADTYGVSVVLDNFLKPQPEEDDDDLF
jgi:hypothetical protein